MKITVDNYKITDTIASLISGTALKCPINRAAQRTAKVICIMDQLVQTILSLSMKPFWPDKRS